MMHFLLILSLSALLGFGVPRIGIRIVKDVCPAFFVRFNPFIKFGFFFISGALVANLFPTTVLWLIMIVFGAPLLRTHSRTVIEFLDRSGSMMSELGPPCKLTKEVPLSCVDRVYYYFADYKEQFEQGPIEFFSFVDHFYDMTKQVLFNVLSKVSSGE
jgi:hypothetical protein